VALKGKYRGQEQKWYAYRFEGDESEIAIDPPPGGHEAEFESWAWRRMEELPGLIVPFKRQVYEQVIQCFAHLAGGNR
jgi:putative (di)nucleoside polyphosphate hydrolase